MDEGRIADVFGPGRHKLVTQTIPLLTNIKNWDKLFQSPFKSDVYFFSTRLKTDRKWGTPNAITIRDKEFGAVRLRAFGIYSYRIADPKEFHKNISGTREVYTVNDLDEQLRATVVGSMTDLLGSSGIPFLDMAANQDEFGQMLKAKLATPSSASASSSTASSCRTCRCPRSCRRFSTSASAWAWWATCPSTRNSSGAIDTHCGGNEGGLAGIGAGAGAGLAIGQQMATAMGRRWRHEPAGPGRPPAGAGQSTDDV